MHFVPCMDRKDVQKENQKKQKYSNETYEGMDEIGPTRVFFLLFMCATAVFSMI